MSQRNSEPAIESAFGLAADNPWRTTVVRFIQTIIVFVGVANLLPGIYFVAENAMFSAGTSSIQGTVVDLVCPSGSLKNGRVPIVEYHVAGQRFTCRGTTSFSPPRHRVGDRMPVVYRRADPQIARLDTFFDRWFAPCIFTAGGFMAVAIGIAFPRLADGFFGTVASSVAQATRITRRDAGVQSPKV
jgi:hypothetical protein